MCRCQLGDSAGTKVMIEVLLLHRRLAVDDLIAGMTVALRLTSASADVVAVEARKAHAGPDPGPGPVQLLLKRRTTPQQPEQVIVLPADPRPLPTVHQYDQLLTQQRPSPLEELIG
jgi:hypothetical protein